MATFVCNEFGVVFSSFDHNNACDMENKQKGGSSHDSASARDHLKKKMEARKKLAEAEKAKKQAEADEEAKLNGTIDIGGGKDVDELGKAAQELSLEDRVAKAEDFHKQQKDFQEMSVKIQARNEEKAILKRLQKSNMYAKGNSKANPSQFVHKQKPADNASRRAVIHHTSSHYVMAGSKQFQRGNRVPGVVARHSVQGARVQKAKQAKLAGESNLSQAKDPGKGKRGPNRNAKRAGTNKTSKAKSFGRLE